MYDVMATLMALASGVGSLLAGLIYDRMGSHVPFLLLGAASCVLDGIPMIPMPRYPRVADATGAAR